MKWLCVFAVALGLGLAAGSGDAAPPFGYPPVNHPGPGGIDPPGPGGVEGSPHPVQSVPSPPPLLLIGAALGSAWLVRAIHTRRRPRDR